MPRHSNEDLEGGDSQRFLSVQSPHDKPWDEHKQAANQVARLYKQIEYIRYSQEITSCARWLEFARKVSEKGEVNLKLFSAWFCRKRHCPTCQWRKSLMWRARMFKALPKIRADYPAARWLFLTLTVVSPPMDELRETIGEMNKAWQRMIKRKEWPALGFVRSIEVTVNHKTGLPHPHFHCLLMVPGGYFSGGRYLPKAQWIDLWQDCLRVNYPPNLKIQTVKPKLKGTSSHADDEAMFVAICETLKYTVKEGDLIENAEWLEQLTKQLSHLRLVNPGGVIRNYLSEEEPEDLIHGDVEPDEISDEDIMLVFDWSTWYKKYVERKLVTDNAELDQDNS